MHVNMENKSVIFIMSNKIQKYVSSGMLFQKYLRKTSDRCFSQLQYPCMTVNQLCMFGAYFILILLFFLAIAACIYIVGTIEEERNNQMIMTHFFPFSF